MSDKIWARTKLFYCFLSSFIERIINIDKILTFYENPFAHMLIFQTLLQGLIFSNFLINIFHIGSIYRLSTIATEQQPKI